MTHTLLGRDRRAGFVPAVILSVVSAGLLSGTAAYADDFDRESIRKEVYCFPVQYARETIEKLSAAGADKTDVVAPPLSPRFRIFDGGDLPQRYFLKTAARSETEFTINADGAVPDFISHIEAAEKGGDICIQDAARIGRPGDDEGLYFEMGLTPEFKNTSGRYSLSELKEGTRDGKSLYKRMIPSVARLFMPNTDHLSLRYTQADTPFQVVAYKGELALPQITAQLYNGAHVFDLDDLEDMDADRLEIIGGDYVLSPVPSIKTMKKFGIGEKKIYTQNSSGEWVR